MDDARDDTRTTWTTTGADDLPDDLVRAVAALLVDIDQDQADQDQGDAA